jgi:hypothetical protein
MADARAQSQRIAARLPLFTPVFPRKKNTKNQFIP